MNSKFSYLINYFRRLYHIPSEIEIGHGTQNKKINIATGDWEYFRFLRPYSIKQVVWKNWNGQNIPFLFEPDCKKPLVEKKADKVFIHYDIAASAFFFLSGWQEYVFMKNTPAFRFPYSESLQAKLNLAKIPVVNYYFDILKEAIESVYNVQLKNKLFARPVVCLTHDIDRTNSGWKEGGLSELKKGHFISPIHLLRKKIFGKDVWFNFEEILRIEEKYKGKSSFYLLSRKRSSTPLKNVKYVSNLKRKDYLKNADYDIRKRAFQEIIAEIEKAEFEVGVHGSFGSHLDAELLLDDIDRLGIPVIGGRFHNLLFDISTTSGLLEKVGLKYDSTLGFAEEIGFRHGIAFPFYLYNFEKNAPYHTIEIPLNIMDTTFRVYKQMSASQAFFEMEKLLKEVQKFNGLVTVLWHNNYFSPYKFAGWKAVYEDFLMFAQNKGFDLWSAKQVCSSFMTIKRFIPT